MKNNNESTSDSLQNRPLASSPCLADQSSPEYMGYMTNEELSEWLLALFNEHSKIAALWFSASKQRGADSPSIEQVDRNVALICADLRTCLIHLGASVEEPGNDQAQSDMATADWKDVSQVLAKLNSRYDCLGKEISKVADCFIHNTLKRVRDSQQISIKAMEKTLVQKK